MVKLRRSVRVVTIATALSCLAVLGVVVGVSAGSAVASPGATSGGWNGGPPAPGPSQPAPNTPWTKNVGGCWLYANSTSFGGSCYQGGGSAHSPTVSDILGGDSANFCWDVKISDTDVVKAYGYTPNPADPYYLHSCVSGLIPSNPPSVQPNVNLSQSVIQIGNADEHPCSGNPGKDQLYPPKMLGNCIMTLTGRQQTIADMLDTDFGRIPGIVLTKHPSTVVRTNEWVAYTDRARGGMTTTPKFSIGGVTMWAQMYKFSIQPYGPNGDGVNAPVSKPCNGTAYVTDADTPQTQPTACWWQYPASSADVQGEAYPFRAEADWTVYYDAGGGAQVLGNFQKYADLQLPVSDIQTIVTGVK